MDFRYIGIAVPPCECTDEFTLYSVSFAHDEKTPAAKAGRSKNWISLSHETEYGDVAAHRKGLCPNADAEHEQDGDEPRHARGEDNQSQAKWNGKRHTKYKLNIFYDYIR
ncbi:hypothetical protein HMPREF1985_01422 [Mitsuokella sp. oral taxon 131 str. W9106]|nr:hypothetical protein HMPREF1985_01422 [Mitsuokella sp. oral taxon 131 str. W9106]